MSIKDVVSVLGQRRWWCVTLICAAVTGVFAVFMVFNPLGLGVTVWLDDIGEGVAAALGAGACAWAASKRDRPSAPFVVPARDGVGIVGRRRGHLVLVPARPRTSGPVPVARRSVLLARRPSHGGRCPAARRGVGAVTRSLRALLDGAIIAGSLLFVSWATALGTVWNSGGEGPFARVVGLAYPIGDVITATVALTALTQARGTGRRQLGLLAAGVVSLAVADSMFAYLTQNGTYGNGNWMDTGWVAGFLLIGLAALSPRRPEPTESSQKGQSTSQLVVPYVPLAFAGATAVVKEVTGHSIGKRSCSRSVPRPRLS